MSFLTIAISILITSTISGAIGMAGGVILMVIYLSMMTIEQAIILQGLTQLSSNGFRALVNRKHINWKIVSLYVLGGLIAFAIARMIDFRPSKQLTYILLGILPFITLFKSAAKKLDIEKKGRAFICGIFVTGAQILCGVSGSMLDIFYLSGKMGRFQIIATKAITQALGHLAKTIFYIYVFQFQIESIPAEAYIASMTIPFIGACIGKKILAQFTDDKFMSYARVTMMILSISLLYKGVFS